MATKTRKTTTTAWSSQSLSESGFDSPGTSKYASPRRSRPPSPARVSRMQEKEDLVNLNDRLAAYIDRVRFLEAENSRLNVQVRSTEEVVRREVTNIKSLYENELGDARKLLDEMAKEKAKLVLEVSKYKSESEEYQTKFHRKERDYQNLEKKLIALESQLAELQARLAESEGRQKQLEKENGNLRADLLAADKQLAKIRKQLEEESLRAADLENRVQSLKEDLAFKCTVFEQELEESRVRTTTELEQVDGRLQEEYEAKLLEALREMREVHEGELAKLKIELEILYESKMGELQTQADRSGSSAGTAWEELRQTRTKFDDLSAELSRLRSEHAACSSRIEDLEMQLAREREESLIRIRAKDVEIAELRATLDEERHEYADLMDTKIKLDREIDAYRKLLEGEEARLNISLEMSESSILKSSSKSGARGGKRKRLTETEEYTQESSSSGYTSSGTAKGGMEIYEVDPDGKFIKLYNTTKKEMHIGGWQLKHLAGGQETVFKFHRTVKCEPGAYVTVWSSDTETTHNPPVDIVMKGQRWFIADTMNTHLISKEEEMATKEMSKSVIKSSSSYRSSGIGGSGGKMHSSMRGTSYTLDEGDKEKCIIM